MKTGLPTYLKEDVKKENRKRRVSEREKQEKSEKACSNWVEINKIYA